MTGFVKYMKSGPGSLIKMMGLMMDKNEFEYLIQYQRTHQVSIDF